MINLLVAAAVALSPVPAWPSDPNPDPAICAAKGGKVVPVCLRQEPFCLIPYSDAGKRCTDKSQCRGDCLYDGADEPKGRVVGACQRNNVPCGCFRTVVKGRIARGICAD